MVRFAQLALAVGLALALVGCGGAAPAGTAPTPSGGPARGALYVFESDAAGFNTKTIFYDTGREVVAFDTQFTPALAGQAIAFLRTKTQSPLRYAVITHPNPDKFNGIPAFRAAGATIVASAATAEAMPGVHAYKRAYFVQAGMFTDATYPALGAVDQTFAASQTLALSDGAAVELRTLGQPGVSSTQTVAYLPAAGALIVGDLVHHQAHAWLEGGIVNGAATPTLDGWIADLEEIQRAYPAETQVYGGRGAAAPLREAAQAQIAYLRRAVELTRGYVRELGARASELQGPGAAQHYQALQQRFAEAFPDYQLSFMVGYGIYGLVNSMR